MMAAKAGAIAIPAGAPAQSPIFVGYKVPAETIYGRPSYRMWLPGAPHAIVVNRLGRRFCNDAFYPTSRPRSRASTGRSRASPTGRPG